MPAKKPNKTLSAEEERSRREKKQLRTEKYRLKRKSNTAEWEAYLTKDHDRKKNAT